MKKVVGMKIFCSIMRMRPFLAIHPALFPVVVMSKSAH